MLKKKNIGVEMIKIILISLLSFQGFINVAFGRIVIDSDSKKSLLKVLEINEKFHQAFFKYDKDLVESHAKEMSKAVGKIPNKNILKLLKYSQLKLKEINAKNTRDLNNKNYNIVSMALIHIINKYDLGDKYNAYSCPMVQKKWVQNSKKIKKVHNPYAPRMPHCGSQDSNY